MNKTCGKFFLFITLLLMVFPKTGICQLANTPWPMFHHDIRHTGKTANFGTQIGKLKWLFVTGGPVISSPAIDNDGILYVGSDDNNLYAISTETGSLEWKFQTGGAIGSSPAIGINGIVYVGSNDGYLYALDTKTIDPSNPTYLWRFQTDGPGAIVSSPAIDNGGNILFGCSDGNLYAVNAGGNLKWKTFVGDTGGSPAIDVKVSQVYIGTWKPDVFYGLDLGAGSIIWQYDLLCGGAFASPVVASDSSVIFGNFTTYYQDPECLPEWKFQVYNFASDGTPNWALAFQGDNDIYTTPALLEDNTFFIGSGTNIWRILPDGRSYLSQSIIGERIESSPAIDGSKYFFVGTNGGRFYCLHADRPEEQTTIVWQYPPEDEDPLETSIISSPAIGNDERHSVYVGASDNNIYAFYDGIRLSGTVELVDTTGGTTQKIPFPAVKITLSSEFMEEDRITFTDSNGHYEFTGLDNFTYTVTPEKPGFVFSPEAATVTIKDDDAKNVNFEGFSGFSLSGKVTDIAGNGLSGVTVTIDGLEALSQTTTTDGSGTYVFTGLSFDLYTVTPELAGFGFSPPFQEVAITSADEVKDKTGIDFTGISGFQISGQVKNLEGVGIQGVTMELSGTASGTDITDASGAYSFTGLENGTYTITPVSDDDFDFNPGLQTVTVASRNVNNIDFVAATGFSISGFVIENGVGLPDVTINLIFISDGVKTGDQENTEVKEGDIIESVQTDDNGFFIFIGVQEGTFRVEPSLPAYGFDPFSITVVVASDDVTNINFKATAGFFITGKTTSLLGLPFPDITVSLDGAKDDITTTDVDGQYSFLGLDQGIYTIAVDEEGYKARPLSRTVNILVESQQDIDFVVFPTCATVYLNIPFFGSSGTLVNIFGINFGSSRPPEDVLVSVDGVLLEAGVYFGTADVSTWVKADVQFWSPVKILAEAPSGKGIVNVYVLNESGCVLTSLTNFFIYGF